MATPDETPIAHIGLLWRGNPAEPTAAPAKTRLRRIFEELSSRGVRAEPVVYAEQVAGAVRKRLLSMDGVLVWVDPIVSGRERSALDEMLREISGQGVFVSAHPDAIQKMGTKVVLYRTREMPWGTDTDLYRNVDDLREQLSKRLRSSGLRVLKQDRGSGGNGVWKIEMVRDWSPVEQALVRVQHAQRGAAVEELCLGDFIDRCAQYFQAFAGSGCIVDQPYRTPR